MIKISINNTTGYEKISDNDINNVILYRSSIYSAARRHG